MKTVLLPFLVAALLVSCRQRSVEPARKVQLLDSGWYFINEDVEGGERPETATGDWEEVTIPHDWAISGAFDPRNDAIEIRR